MKPLPYMYFKDSLYFYFIQVDKPDLLIVRELNPHDSVPADAIGENLLRQLVQ